MQKRARICSGYPVLLVDDNLIAYIALHPGEHLQALLRVAIQTFSTNPYDDYGGRPVPSEMFFGRQKELAKLREVKSIGVLYGGRRLGKSSLLSQIVRETQNIPGHEAVYISMDTVTISGDHVTAAWEFVYYALEKQGIVSAMPPSRTRKWTDYKDWVEKELISNKSLKSLYLLIDEADALMGCELKTGGEAGFVRTLQLLIDNVPNCHVRYVIAGLHNMTRMTTDENSVFGKVEPIALEPFNTPEDLQRGISLITKPLAAMGYLFGPGSEDLPLRVLSVCNFYPAFIQLYCKKLVDRLQNRRQKDKPPILISASDLDSVENDNTLLSDLRTKFELNLNLDKRYKAIALILAEVYYSEIESGQYRGLTVSEIRDYCEDFASSHFEHTGPGAYEALLDEMCKLNVLERTGSRYILRNPHIAMMVGDRDRVNTQLEELARETPSDTRNTGERRINMESGNQRHVFPMPVGWVNSKLEATEDGELLIVTGNNMSGLSDVVTSIGRDTWMLGHNGSVSILLGSGPGAASDAVNKNRRPGSGHISRRLLIVRAASWSVDQINEFASIAARAGKGGMRIALFAPPERAFDLAMAMDEGRLPHDGTGESQRSWDVVPVPPWSEDAIFFSMSENIQVADNSTALKAILDATCGFGVEGLRLCKSSLTVAEAIDAPARQAARIAPDLETFYQHVGMPPAFDNDRRRNVEGFLSIINGEKRQSMVVEDTRKDCGVTKGEMHYMQWIGLLQNGPAGTWKVPTIYASLIG